MKTFRFLALLALSVLSLSAIYVVEAQTEILSQPPSPTAVLLPTISPVTFPLTIEQRLASLENKVNDLEKKSERPQKDVWDQISAISGLFSAVLVAVIGGVATYVYNERKRISEAEHNKRQLDILRIQTIQTFMPLLQSNNPKTVKAALIAMAGINLELSIELAQLFQNQEAIEALSKMKDDLNV